MPDYLPPVVAKLNGDDSGLGRTLDQSLVKVKKFAAEAGKIKATVGVDADLTRLDAKLQQAKSKNVDLKVKLDLAGGEVTRIRRQIASPAARMDVKLDLAAGAKQLIAEKVKENALQAKVKLDLAAGEVARIRQKVASPAARMQVKLDLATGTKQALAEKLKQNAVEVKVKPKIDQLALARVNVILRELGKRIDVSLRPTVDQAYQVAADARLAHLARDRTATIRAVVLGGGGGGGAGGGMGMLSTLVSLAPALVPVVASLSASTLSLAASLGASAVAAGAFGAAVIPQIMQFKNVTDAQTKATAAAKKYGEASTQNATAQAAVNDALSGMPAQTRQAAGAYLVLRENFKDWSDNLAKFSMKPVEQGIESVDALLPHLSPLVKDTSAQFGRLTTMLGGEINSNGFDGLMSRFTTFTNGALKRGVDDIVHVSRVLSEGQADGPLNRFMAYAKEEGPAVRETLENIAKAVMQLLKGASEAGPGILTLVNDAAKLVASLPPQFIARVMQLYTAYKLLSLSRTGISAVATASSGLATQLTALRTASTAAGGGLAGVRAALATLSTGTKVAGAIAVVAGVVMVMKSLSDSGKHAPDVDRMTTAVGELGRTGKSSGELLATFGPNLDGLGKAIDRVSGKASGMDKFNDVMNKVFTLGMGQSNSMKEAKKDLDAIDKGLASLVSSGHADQAAAALKEFAKSGNALPKDKLDDYNSALADAAFESQLVADSQGLFGSQALEVKQKLDAQKASADGLRQSIQALNDVNRAGLDAESDFEQAIDDATKAIKGHHHALTMVDGQLNLNSQAARDAYKPLSDLADKTGAAAAAARDQGKDWATVYGIYERGRSKLIANAEAMGLNTTNAKKLADQILATPDKTATLKGDITDLQAKIDKGKADLKTVPPSKKAALQADIAQWLSQIAKAKTALASVTGKTVGINIVTTHTTSGTVFHEHGAATGALVTGGVRKMADGGFGRPAMMARGGTNILWGEGPDESYIPHDQRPRSKAIAEQTVAIMGGSVNWGGGKSGGAAALGGNVGDGLIQGLTASTPGVAAAAAGMGKAIVGAFSSEMQIASPSKKMRPLGAYTVSGLVQGLTGSTASVKAATKRISSMLYVDFGSGHKALQNAVAKDNQQLLALANHRDSVATKLKAAQSKLASLQKAWASEKASIANGIMQSASIITASPDAGRSVNAADVLTQMQAKVKQALQFAANLRQLQKLGLRSDLIQQLATAGVDAAGDTAQALAAGSKSQIAAMNKMQASLQTAANGTGAAVADAMYGAGIRSAQGLVKGLQSQEKAIDAQMLRIALGMQKAIKKALGIRSPSTVMALDGDNAALGFAHGVRRSTKHAVIAAQGLAMSVRQGASMVSGPVGVSHGGTVIHTHYHADVTFQGSLVTEREMTRDVVAVALKDGLRNASTWPDAKR